MSLWTAHGHGLDWLTHLPDADHPLVNSCWTLSSPDPLMEPLTGLDVTLRLVLSDYWMAEDMSWTANRMDKKEDFSGTESFWGSFLTSRLIADSLSRMNHVKCIEA